MHGYSPHYAYAPGYYSYGYAPGYYSYGYAPGPVYSTETYAYSRCHFVRQQVWTDFGPRWRRVRVQNSKQNTCEKTLALRFMRGAIHRPFRPNLRHIGPPQYSC